MPTITNPNQPVFNRFFASVLHFGNLASGRQCPALSDLDWLIYGVLRVLQQVTSGRDFLQHLSGQLDQDLERSHYFETLKSSRRLAFIQQAAGSVRQTMQEQMPDALAGVAELADFAVFAGDAHWHEHATHDPAKWRCSGEDSTKTKFAVGHLYGINLRTRALCHLAHCDEVARAKEHDMRALKRLDVETLRQGTPKGKKVLWIWDRAGIDFTQWHRWKQSKGIYFLSRAKSNMNRQEVAPMPWDRNDPVNHGIEENGIMLQSSSSMMRLVRYRDPLSDEVYEFITNDITLRPGTIAQLYRMRWDIEKAFDDFKSKLAEQKAWAKSDTAKTMQAQFICLTHNLLSLYEEHLRTEHGIVNAAEDDRRQRRIDQAKKTASEAGKSLPALYLELARATQIPLKLIRWLRIHLFSSASWELAQADLQRRYARL